MSTTQSRKTPHRLTSGLLLSLCLLLSLPAGAADASPVLRAGASVVALGKPLPDGDALEVNALVLVWGDRAVAFCVCDGGALDTTLVKAVDKALVARGSRIGADNLLLGATHSHSGGVGGVMEGLVQELAYGRFRPERLATVTARVVEAITAAEARLGHATLHLGQSRAPELNANRSFPEDEADPTLLALHVETASGRPLAILVNYAAHPTILFRRARGQGRDFPGGLARQLREAAEQPDLPVLFFNGALANVGPQPPQARTPRGKAEAMGRALGRVVQEARPQAQPLTPLRHLEVTVAEKPLPPALLGDLVPRRTRLTTVALQGEESEARFLTLPGEVGSQIGQALRSAMGEGTNAFLLGLTNDYLGYHPNRDEFFAGTYESQMCFYGPALEGWYLAAYGLTLSRTGPRADWENVLAAKERIGRDRAGDEGTVLRQRWQQTAKALRSLAGMLQLAGVTPKPPPHLQQRHGPEPFQRLALQYLAVEARKQLRWLSPQDRAYLQGLAVATDLPFDALFILQFLKTPGRGDMVNTVVASLPLGGMDLIGLSKPTARSQLRLPAFFASLAGNRRPGSPAGRQAETWLARVFQGLGCAVTAEPVVVLQQQSAPCELVIEAKGTRFPMAPRPFLDVASQETVGPLVWLDEARAARFEELSGAVVVTPQRYPGQGLPQLWQERLPGTSLAEPTEDQPATWRNAGGLSPARAAKLGAAALVQVLVDQPGETVDRYWPYHGPTTGVPTVYASATTGGALKALAAAKPRLRLRHGGSHSAATHSNNVLATLPGPKARLFLFQTHHDSPHEGAVEDGTGLLALYALARHYARLPEAERPGELVFAMTAGHFSGAAGIRQLVASYSRAWKGKAVASFTLEHLGARTAVVGPDGRLRAGEGLAPRALFVPDRPPLREAVASALAAHPLPQLLVLPARSKVFPGPPGEAGPLLDAGLPAIQFISAPPYLLTSDDETDMADLSDVEAVVATIIAVVDRLSRAAESGGVERTETDF